MSSSHCKQPERAARRAANGALLALKLTVLLGLATLSACQARPHPKIVRVNTLESAAAVQASFVRRAIVCDTDQLSCLVYPLGPRLGLLEVRTEDEWEVLRSCAPDLGAPPDFARGIAVGVVSRAGLPLDGNWPVHLESVRVHEGAGFATARFRGGSYLPDGTTYLELAQYDGLAAVLMVEVNGSRFYPKQGR